MDPFSQFVFGATFAVGGETLRKRNRDSRFHKSACIIGALSGMAPDLDVLIRSSTDPLLALEYHRHFTHSLAFVPFGAALCALVFYWFIRKRNNPGFFAIYF